MIQHQEPPPHGGPFVFAELVGFTCSICAPADMAQGEIEAFATRTVRPEFGPWRAVDKSQPPISIPGKTPNPCNHDPTRLHWFLVCGELP